MEKLRVKELAEELGLKNKDVISYLQEQGVESVKSYNSVVEEEDAKKVRAHFGGAKGAGSPQADAVYGTGAEG